MHNLWISLAKGPAMSPRSLQYTVERSTDLGFHNQAGIPLRGGDSGWRASISQDKEQPSDCRSAIAQIPGGLFVLTATFEGRRSGILVKWAQPCSNNPPMVMVALATGQAVEPLIRD